MRDIKLEYFLITELSCIVIYPILTYLILSQFELTERLTALISVLAPLVLTLITLTVVMWIVNRD